MNDIKTAVTEKQEQLPQTRAMARSIQKDDNGVIHFYMNDGWGYSVALPRELPPQSLSVYHRKRDILTLSAPHYEEQWANALSIATSKMAVSGFDVESNIALRRKNIQNMLLEAGAGFGIFGWVPFLTVHLNSFFATGIGFVEIERATPANGSKLINIHHLDPLRCVLTGRNDKPVEYLHDDGKSRLLNWYQVMIISDNLPVSNYSGGAQTSIKSAASRAWKSITKLAAIETFIYERVSGQRPLKLSFMGGVTRRNIEDAIQSSQNEATRKGLQSYMGAALIPVPGDIPINLVEIPLADLPDITDVERERLRADLIYANALGLDPQDINPNLVGRQGLGSTGNQSAVLADKERGRFLFKWQKEFSHQLNQLALDDKTTFTFSERDLRDEGMEADNASKRQETRGKMVDAGMITAVQATNLAVDAGDLPSEFLDQDVTGGDTLRDDEKEDEKRDKTADQTPAENTENTEKARSRGAAEQKAMFAKMGASGSLRAKGPDGKRTGGTISASKYTGLNVEKTPAMAEGDYVDKKGGFLPDTIASTFGADFGPNRRGQAAQRQTRRANLEALNEAGEKREQARREYRSLVESGKIRTPSPMEQHIWNAAGFRDRQDVQASRRIVSKRLGIPLDYTPAQLLDGLKTATEKRPDFKISQNILDRALSPNTQKETKERDYYETAQQWIEEYY